MADLSRIRPGNQSLADQHCKCCLLQIGSHCLRCWLGHGHSHPFLDEGRYLFTCVHTNFGRLPLGPVERVGVGTQSDRWTGMPHDLCDLERSVGFIDKQSRN